AWIRHVCFIDHDIIDLRFWRKRQRQNCSAFKQCRATPILSRHQIRTHHPIKRHFARLLVTLEVVILGVGGEIDADLRIDMSLALQNLSGLFVAEVEFRGETNPLPFLLNGFHGLWLERISDPETWPKHLLEKRMFFDHILDELLKGLRYFGIIRQLAL